MSYWFSFKEGLKGFRRARLATTITITSIAFALLLVGVFLTFSINVQAWIGDVRSKIELEVFLEPLIDNASGQQIREKISGIDGVGSVEFVSKEKAAERFHKEFGRNIYEALESNPLPASCVVKMKPGSQSSLVISKIIARINELDGVTDVVYQKEALALIDHYLQMVYLIVGGVGFILILIAVILLNNTIRLTILARKDIIHIMQLVGAKESFIRRPFVIEGFIQGLLGALLANIMIIGVERLIKAWFYARLLQRSEIYGFVLLTGLIIGIFSSRISVSKYLKRV
jgi:cell division transport system permease protein